MLGLGALALPSVFARLGWLPAAALLAACALGALYSGRLFTTMAQQVCCACHLQALQTTQHCTRSAILLYAKQLELCENGGRLLLDRERRCSKGRRHGACLDEHDTFWRCKQGDRPALSC